MPQIRSLRDGLLPINGDRTDLAAGNVVTLLLDDVVGVRSYAWSLLSRPEFSTAAGPAGPEVTAAVPNGLSLGTLPTATFTADADDVVNDILLDGTYEVQVVLNDGSPSRQALRARLSRVSTATIPGPGGGTSTLRRPATHELLDGRETARTWKNDLARWLDRVRRDVGSGGGADPSIITLVAGAPVAIGDAVAVETATGNGLRARSDSAALANCIGVALQAGVVPLLFQVRVGGDVPVNAAGLTIGRAVYLTAAGGFASAPNLTAGQYREYLGTAITGARISLHPGEPELNS